MEIKNFAILNGKDITIKDGVIKLDFVPVKKTGVKENKELKVEDYAHAEIRSDLLFSNGELELKFKRTSFASGVLFLFPIENNDFVTVGMSYYSKAFTFSSSQIKGNQILKVSDVKYYELADEHTIKITVFGSQIKLFVDKILLGEVALSIKEGPIMLRIASEQKMEIYDIKAKVIRPKVFVVMQFTKEYNELYEEVIKPVVENRGYECIRADEFYTSTPILKDIIDSISQSNIIIAEITPDNPNVFYEIGYSHAINKPTILLCDRKREKLPFDLSSFRTLFYENTIAGKKKIEENLKKYLDNLS